MFKLIRAIVASAKTVNYAEKFMIGCLEALRATTEQTQFDEQLHFETWIGVLWLNTVVRHGWPHNRSRDD